MGERVGTIMIRTQETKALSKELKSSPRQYGQAQPRVGGAQVPQTDTEGVVSS